MSAEDTATETVFNNFRLLQACDNLSLLSCVAFDRPATLLHSFPTSLGPTEVQVEPLGPRHFRLAPYPFDQPTLTFTLPARHVEGHVFDADRTLERAFHHAPVEDLTVTITA